MVALKRAPLDLLVLDGPANDIEDIEYPVDLLNNESIGWKEEHCGASGRAEVITALVRLIKDDLVEPYVWAVGQRALMDAGRGSCRKETGMIAVQDDRSRASAPPGLVWRMAGARAQPPSKNHLASIAASDRFGEPAATRIEAGEVREILKPIESWSCCAAGRLFANV